MAEKKDFVKYFMPVQGEILAYILTMGVPPSHADDVLQNTAVVILEKIGEFEAGSNFRAWAYSIAKFEILSFFKEHQKSLCLTKEALEHLELLSTDTTRSSAVTLKALTVCLEKLQEKARDLINMRYTKGLTSQDIADKLSRPVDSIYTSLSRIRKSLQECVKGFDTGGSTL